MASWHNVECPCKAVREERLKAEVEEEGGGEVGEEEEEEKEEEEAEKEAAPDQVVREQRMQRACKGSHKRRLG